METYKKLEAEVNAIKEINTEAGNILHNQLTFAQNAKWTFDDLTQMIKGDNDVADKFFSDDEEMHHSVRNTQDGIINYYSEY